MKASLANLDAKGAVAIVAAISDLTLLLDRSGLVLDVALGNEELSQLGSARWIGKSWLDTVTVESRDKLGALLKVRAGKTSAPRQVNHPVSAGQDIPIVYQTHALASGQLVATGRDLRATAALQQRLLEAQQAMEDDYARLRQVDSRYRLLFQTTPDAVIVADATTGEVSELNPAAAREFGLTEKKSQGKRLLDLFGEANGRALQAMLDTTRATGRADAVRLVTKRGRARRELLVGAALFRQDGRAHVLLRIAPADRAAGAESPSSADGLQLSALLERLPDGFVVTDGGGRILMANSAFLDVTQLGTFEQARGQSLDRWLGRSPVDVRVLLNNLQQHGAVRLFATQLRGELGLASEVEVSAVAAVQGDASTLGFVVRDINRPATTRETTRSATLTTSAEQLSELIGRVSLKELVRESTDMIERLCIEAALDLTGDNRASAAEMLGLSRQSLYIKLRRHGLGNLDGDAETG